MLANSFPFLQGSNIQLYYSYQVCLIIVPLLIYIELILKNIQLYYSYQVLHV